MLNCENIADYYIRISGQFSSLHGKVELKAKAPPERLFHPTTDFKEPHVTNDIIDLATQVGRALQAKGLLLATAESCTGGGVAQAITEVAGSTGWFDCGFIAYSNASKTEMLDVSAALIAL